MCFGMGCSYEDGMGECKKPSRVPCPMEDEEAHEEYWDEYEEAQMKKFYRKRDEKLLST